MWKGGAVFFQRGLTSRTVSVVLIRLMGKIEETSLHLVHPYKWKTSHVVGNRQLDSQLCTEFGTHVKKSVPFPVVTPAMTDCLIKQRPQFITLMNSWLSRRWRGDDIHTDRAHFQRTSSQRQRGRESFIDLGQSCYSRCCRVSATCVCARPPSQKPACLIIFLCHLSTLKSSWRKETESL